ncbi:MAG: DHH family phosphoesterase [Candidatus Saccharimonadales bacterium]
MNESTVAKQQIIEKIKGSSNILVTVGRDPSVDALSAALGMTILLNNLGKHATAVVSGVIPPAISFLEPEKTFEGTVDSLRDFIIALDKEKADHLRYKLDGDVVKIFITPYRTTITQDDLEFSQGDYNVELVLALGVQDQDHLDKALEAHGRILHDATTAVLSSGSDESKLGDINWHEPNASSISEMLTSISEALKNDKPIVDEQIATAFLTGIVAATDRFSNNKTSSKVMTIAAQLMAAGANQQLIAAKLEEARAISSDHQDATSDSDNGDGTTNLTEGESTKVEKGTEVPKANDGSLAISHESEGTLEQVAEQVAVENQEDATKKAEDELAKQLGTVTSATNSSTLNLNHDLQQEAQEAVQPDIDAQQPTEAEPLLGGTLNATTEQAAEDKRRDDEDSRNRTILTHDNSSHIDNSLPSFIETPFSASMTPPSETVPSLLFESPESTNTSSPLPIAPEPPLADSTPAPNVETSESSVTALPSLSPIETLADLDAKNRGTIDHADALADVHAAFDMAPISTLPPSDLVSSTTAEPVTLPSLPPSEVSTLPPLPLPPTPPVFEAGLPPAEPLGQLFETPPSIPPLGDTQSSDPNQFKIPGQ